MAKISIAIPTYNEKDNVVPLVLELNRILPSAKILIVDDNSPDGTPQVLRGLQLANLLVHVRENERGLGSAIRFGLKSLLDSDYIVTMDADLSHDPKYLPNMIQLAINGNYDLVIGSRYVKGGGIENWSFSRRIISKGANYLFRIVSHSPLKDNTSNYRVYSRLGAMKALECETTNGYEFQICSIYKIIKSGLKVTEYPIIFRDRKIGKSKLSMTEIISWFVYILKLSLSS